MDLVLRGAAARAYLEELFAPHAGESPGAYAARCVRGLGGAHPDADGILYQLAARVETRPGAEEYRATNCATSMRWIWAWLGCPHPWASMPDEQLRAIAPAGPVAWCLEIARAQGAFVDCRGRDVREFAGPGWCLHYATPGCNDDHVEWVLSLGATPTDDEHGGGGRGGNRITIERGDVRRSVGRPVLHAIDPSKMGFRRAVEPDEVTPIDVPHPTPRPPPPEPAPATDGNVHTASIDGRAVALSALGVAAAVAARWFGGAWWAALLLVAGLAVAVAIYFWRRSR